MSADHFSRLEFVGIRQCSDGTLQAVLRGGDGDEVICRPHEGLKFTDIASRLTDRAAGELARMVLYGA